MSVVSSVSRTLVPLLTLVGVAACGQGFSVDEVDYSNRSPALRTIEAGVEYALDAPAGLDDITDLTSAGTLAFVGYAGDGCDVVAVHAWEDAEAGVRSPFQVLDGCNDAALDGGFSSLVDARGDTLVAGGQVFRIRDGGVDPVIDLTGNLPAEHVVTGNLVVDDDVVALATDHTVYVFATIDGEWTHTQRFPRTGSTLHFADGALAVGPTIYHRSSLGGFAEVGTLPFGPDEVLDIRDSRVVAGTYHESQVFEWTGESYTLVSRQAGTNNATSLQLTRAGVANLWDGELVLFDAEGEAVSHDTLTTSGRGSLLHVDGDRALAHAGRVLTWLQFVADTPEDGTLLNDEATLARGEEHRARFDVPAGTASLTVVLAGTGDADLYVRRGDAPTHTAYDCSPFRHGSDEVCTFENPEPGAWFVAVRGFAGTSDVVVTASIE